MKTPSDIPTRETVEFLESALGAGPLRLLEVGCGSGAVAAALQSAGHRVVALDPSPEAISETRRLGVDAHCVAWLDFSPAETFDAIIFVRSLHHLFPLEASTDHAAQFLRPGGRVIVDDFAFHEADLATVEWFATLVRILRASQLLDPPEHSFVDHLLASSEMECAWQSWGSDHHQIHPAKEMAAALERRFSIVARDVAPYAYRYLAPCLPDDSKGADILEQFLASERRLIDLAVIQPIGRRFVARRTAGA